MLPEGIGTINPKGLAFYDKLIDELVANDIEPYITLFHWDFPYELYCRGGWLNPNSSNWFAEYAGVVVEKLSDRVKNWITFNEPQCFLGLGHFEGIDAPGLKLPVSELLLAGHNVFLSHGKAVQAIRAKSKQQCRVGYAPVGIVKIPVTETQADIEASKKAMFSVEQKNYDNNTWWMDPVYLGRYPEDGVQLFGADMPKFAAKDLETISQQLDFFGVNVYHGQTTQMNEQGKPENVSMPLGHGLTTMNWTVTPDSLYWGVKFFYERYKKTIFITENGMANTDWVALDGRVHDPQRIDFLNRYLLSLRRACEEGFDIGGYFLWSIMDNFEWSSGFSKRFGIIYVDYATQQRVLKDSAYWYRDVIASNGQSLDTQK